MRIFIVLFYGLSVFCPKANKVYNLYHCIVEFVKSLSFGDEILLKYVGIYYKRHRTLLQCNGMYASIKEGNLATMFREDTFNIFLLILFRDTGTLPLVHAMIKEETQAFVVVWCCSYYSLCTEGYVIIYQDGP